MPSIKNFEKKSGQKSGHSTKNHEKTDSEQKSTPNSAKMEAQAEKVAKRRPGRENAEGANSVDVKVVHVDQEIHAGHEEGKNMEQQNADEIVKKSEETVKEAEQISAQNKIEINFPGSELIRSKFPQPFDIAEAVATDWVNDGKFEAIPLKQPLAKTVAQQGLLKAKEIEKKVMASPTTEKIAMQAFTYAMKAQGLYNELKNEIKAKVNKKQ